MSSLPAVIETPALGSQGTDLVARAQALEITDAATFAEAAEFAKLVKAYLTEVDSFMGPIVASAHAAHKTAVGKRDGLKKYALDAEGIVKQRMAAYHAEQERIRREQEEAARRERERLEAEERARVAAENARLQAEAEEARLREALEAEQRGDAQAARRIIEAPVVAPTVAARPVFVPPVQAAQPPKVDGVAFRETWDFEIVDESRVPREYLQVDRVKLGQVVRAMKGRTSIPGVRVFSKPVTSVRA
jgi:hypothetical protein